MKRPLLLALLALLAAGCVHSSTRERRGFAGIRGEPTGNEFAIVVDVFADGRLELFGRGYDRDGLVEKLLDLQGGVVTTESRMIVLKGHDGTTVGQLASLQDFLISRRLYRVSFETPREASAQGVGYAPILPAGGLQVQVLDPNDPIVRELDR